MARRGAMIGMTTLLLAGCDMPAVRPNQPADAEGVARGRDAAERLGCGACHAMPGIAWPRSPVGPSLEDFATRAMIAGRLPNRPDTLARFVRDAPALVPGTAMPAIPMRERDAEDIAAYLHGPAGE